MELINLVGDRLFLDYLITANFDFTYENNRISIDYNSHLELADIDNKLATIQQMLTDIKDAPDQDSNYTGNLNLAIEILTNLRAKIA